MRPTQRVAEAARQLVFGHLVTRVRVTVRASARVRVRVRVRARVRAEVRVRAAHQGEVRARGRRN